MRALKALSLTAIIAAIFVTLASFAAPVSATPQNAKKTGKKCNYCHVGNPKEKNLTEQGKCFKEKGSLDDC